MSQDPPKIAFNDFTWMTRFFSPSLQERDRAELLQLHQQANELYNGSALTDQKALYHFWAEMTQDIQKACDPPLPEELTLKLAPLTYAFAMLEPALFEAPEPLGELTAMSLHDEVERRDLLRDQIFHLSNIEDQTANWRHQTAILFLLIVSELPPLVDQSNKSALTLSAPLATLLHNPKEIAEQLISYIYGDQTEKTRFFKGLRKRILHNLLAVNRLSKEEFLDSPKPLRMNPSDIFNAHPPLEAIEMIFAGTPLHDLLTLTVDLPVPEEVRFEHMHILAGTGHGKTQTLQHLIVGDLQRPLGELPSMVILDSQGDMLKTLSRLSLFDPTIANSLASRVLIVDPSDVAFAPALNLFDIQSERLANYDQKDREQVLAGIIEIYDYIFGGLLGAELTQKQAMVFRFLAQLMLTIPGSTIHTLRELLIDASPFAEHISKLPNTARGFFETQFFERGYNATREQILRRLYGVLQNPSFERMFASPQNLLDLFDVLNEGGIVLVNTAKDFLKSESSSMFGRYIIALTFKAAMERAILPHEQRRPTFLWIDEASEYFDDNIDNLLIQARKYKLGLVMAHQYLGQLPRGLPASMMTNTSIKLAGGLSDRDTRELSREMRCTPDFISDMTKQRSNTNFAAFVRNTTPHALKFTIPFGTAESLPQMPEEHFEILREASRSRLSSPPLWPTPSAMDEKVSELKSKDPVTPPPPATEKPDEDEFWEDS